MHRVAPSAKASLQGFLRLWRSHGHRDHFRAIVRSRMCDSCRVERIEEQRHAFAFQLLRLLVELDRVRARNLFDEADDFHL